MITNVSILGRLILALLLGGIIGFEREITKRSAGLRTHILVALGSCLIMLTSLYVFDIYKDIVLIDPSRIAAGVVTGIGFLGAGAIIRGGEGIKGLTTAASLWVVSGIGLAVGCGFYLASIVVAVLVLVVLFVLGNLEKIISKDKNIE